MTPATPHRKKLRRYELPGGIHFLTFSCRLRLQLFQNDSIKDAFVKRLEYIHRNAEVNLFAWVVMPEHIHLLVRPLPPNHRIQNYLARLKPKFAKQVLQRWRDLDAPIMKRIVDASGQHHFWQPGGGYDRNIFSSDEYLEKLNYIHHNPVKRGLVDQPEDWRWSSARHYLSKKYAGPFITPFDPQ